MYILLTDESTVAEIIPDENPIFPGVPIEQRYAPDFVAKLLHFPDETEVEQNWVYDPETQTFAEPPEPEPSPEPEPEPEPDLESIKAERIAQSKTDLNTYLLEHPLQWTDGEYYAITAEKQNQLTSKIMAATMAQTMSTDYTLTWNSTGEVCKEWALPDLYALAFAIDARVTALVTYQQTKEVAMRNAETMEELEAITVNYDEVV